jgi:hypothetical protein
MGVGGVACRPIQVSSKWGPGVKFNGLGTMYRWMTVPTEDPDSGQTTNPQFRRTVLEALEWHLAAAGFFEAEDDTCDFLLRWGVATEERGVRIYGESYEMGSLILEAIDRDDQSLIWRGVAQAKLHPADPPEQRKQRIDEAAKRLVEQFKPQEGN